METELIERIDAYIELFEIAFERTGDEQLALAVFHELAKDRRMALIHRQRQRGWAWGLRDGHDDGTPATPSQKDYLKYLPGAAACASDEA